MFAKGSDGEKYILDKKKKQVHYNYTDYSVSSSIYVARIMDRKYRDREAEIDVKEAVSNGTYYNDERPLSVLYMGGKFAGFLYEGDGSLIKEVEDVPYNNNFNYIDVNGDIMTLGIQVVVAIVMALVGYFAIYPMLVKFMINTTKSSIVEMLHYLDYNGIPAILVGILMQTIVFSKFKDSMNNFIIGGLIAFIVNLVGIVGWTIFVMFLMKYIIWIILGIVLVIILGIVIYIFIKSIFS